MKKFKVKFILLAIGIDLLLLGIILSANPNTAEWMATHINRYYIYLMGHLTSLVPFSIFAILVGLAVIAILFILIYLIILLIKKRFKKALNIFINTVLVVLIIIGLYSFVTSPSYKRKEAPLPKYQEEVSNESVKDIVTYFISDFSDIARRVTRDDDGNIDLSSYYTYKELSDQMSEEFERLDDEYYSSYTPRFKTVSLLLSDMNVTGITFSLTGEANVNKVMPDIDKAFTIAHELAHTKGVMREDDANLVALYICLTSDDDIIRYSGYFRAYSHLLSAAFYTLDRDTYRDIVSLIDPLILKEISNYNKYWQEHDTLDKIQDWWNDLYLKINGVKTGIDTYNDEASVSDSGAKRDDGTIIYNISYSDTQKLLFYLYFNN